MHQSAPNPWLLEVDHLSKTFPQVAALEDVSFNVSPGTIHAILGEDGAGKTTLMRIIGGVYPAGSYQGQVLLAGTVLRLRSPGDGLKQRISVVQRRPTVFPRLTVAENVMLPRWNMRHQFQVDPQTNRLEAQAILDRWQIDLDVASSAEQLDPGRQRLLMIARALATEPLLVVLDEPLFGIGDQQAASRVLRLVRRLEEQRLTCLYLARRPGEACQIADRATVLRDGRVVGSWDRAAFDEGDMAQAMASQRPGTFKNYDDEEIASSGLLGSLQDFFNRLGRFGS